jgi:hypothetical protein
MIRPTTNSVTPAQRMPPSAAGIPPCVLAASTGAMNANDDPV